MSLTKTLFSKKTAGSCPLPFKLFFFTLIFILTAATNNKDDIYYIRHLDEARQLLDTRCKFSTDNDMFTKDFECVAARSAVQRDIEVKERNTLIETLHKKKDKLATKVKIEAADKQRYEIFKKSFASNIEKTGDFIIECFKSDRRVLQNGVECVAAVDSMLEILEKKRDEDLVKNEKEINYRGYYQRYFRQDEKRVDEVLNGRCKELFANQWYRYDPELQDKECNIAAEEKRRNKRLNNVTRSLEKKKEERDVEYYAKRIQEAFALKKECDSGDVKNEKNCINAKEAIVQLEENKIKTAEFKKIYERDILAAQKTADDCRAGDNTNNLECLTATTVINEDARKGKEQQELTRHLQYYRGNIEEAKKLLAGRCNLRPEISAAFVKDTECIAIKRVMDEDTAFKERDKLIEQLNTIRTTLLKTANLDKKENQQRYNNFKESFSDDNNSAEEFVLSCVSDKQRASHNVIECLASTDSLVENLQKARDEEVEKLQKEAQYRDNYQKRLRYLKEHEEEAEVLLNGRCKSLFANPWYDYDEDVQDSECNAALEARRSTRRAELLSRSGFNTANKDLTYFRSNIKEAIQLEKECLKGDDIDKKLCDFASQVIKEENEKKQNQIEYRKYYSQHVAQAAEVAKQCQSLAEKDRDKCQVVMDIVSREIKTKKDEEKLKHFIAFYRINVKKAAEFIAKNCKDVASARDENQLECRGAAEVTKEITAAKVNSALLEDLLKLKENIISEIKAGDADKKSYEKLRDYYKANINAAQEFVLSCAKDNVILKHRRMECLASINSMVEHLEENKENSEEESNKAKSFKESRKSYFKSHSDEADKLLEGRCKPILADPWYRYDKDLQDKECNAAFSDKRRRDELKQFADILGDNDEKKDLAYYKKNIAKAKVFSDECKNAERTPECEFATEAIAEIMQEEAKKSEFEQYFSQNLIEAKKIVDDCNAQKETDKLKCHVANHAFAKSVRSKRDKKEFARYVNYFKANTDEAKSLSEGKCKHFMGNEDSIFIEDIECSAVAEAVKINEELNGRNELISGLALLKRKIAPNFANTSNKNYKSYFEFFENRPQEVEKFIASCAESGNRAKQNNLECVAAIDFMLIKFEEQRKEDEAKLAIQQKYKEYFRKTFKENPAAVDNLLEGRCKILFADPWYGYDPDTQDRECDAALAERRATSKASEKIKLIQQKNYIKDLDYYRKNIEEADSLARECKNGVVKSLSDCEMALRVDNEISSNAKKRIEYTEFYKDHAMAAQFHLRWCKSAMLNFDTECQVVSDILKDHVNRVEDPELVKKYTELFRNNPQAALASLKGVCADKITDSWYFLDVNLQTEECNAALEVVK